MYNLSSFDEFVELLEHGREIEFKYDNNFYSFNYWNDGSEYTCNNKLILKSNDRNKFIDKIKTIIIDNISLKEIVDNKLYDINTLYVM